MAAFKVKNMWNVFLTAFFAVLASLGLTAPAATAAEVAQQPAEQPVPAPAPAPAVVHKVTEDPSSRVTAPRQLMPRDRSLPPTIKQRIRAEAHGSSPSVRHLPADLPADDDVVRETVRDRDHSPAAVAETEFVAA
jgi:hypothetical protein